MDFINGLNAQQQQAVMAGLGPVLVLAGPGSGKTRVLTQRIAYLIGSMGVSPYHILAVTFTNKAAREMESRVVNLLGETTRGLTLGTFHAICARILRREAEHLPFNSNFVIFDSDDQLSLAKRAIADLNLDEKRYRATSVHASISNAKNELVLPENFPTVNYRDEVVKRIYIRYQELLLANNALDFDDLLLWTAFLLEENPVVREKYARRYEHVLVDEFQDTNQAQYTLLKHLASFHHNIFVVGDTDQCLPAGTPIQTPQGLKPIQAIQAGECVVAASGRGATMPAMINHVGKREYKGDLVRVVTKQGLSFLATPNHIVFARLGINPDNQHYVPREKLLRHAINLRYFGDGRRGAITTWNAHRIDIWGSDAELKHRLEARGYRVQKGNRQSWRVGFSRLQFDDVQALAEELSQIDEDLDIVTGAFLVNTGNAPLAPRFSLMPASHLHPTMFVAIERNGQILQDEISEVTREPYQGKVYDLEVADVHNYVANGVVVHNSIYRWRGADYRNVLRFEEDYPDSQVILLEQNYRSTQAILDVAMAVIDRNPYRTPKRLFTERGHGQKVTLYEAYDDRVEASFVVDTIASMVARNQAQPGDFAIMYRTNAQSRLLEEAFLQANLPYKLVGAQRFYGRREVKDIIAFLRLVHNPNDEISLGRVINVPPRGIGDKTALSLRTQALKTRQTPGELLLELGRDGENPLREVFTGRAGASLSNFANLFANWVGLKGELPPLAMMDRILEDVDYHNYIDDGTEEGHDRWENVMELRRLAAEYQDQGLETFLEQVALVSDQDTLETSANVPTLLTLHAAKGLEFPIVIIIGLNDGTLPHSRSFDDPEQMMEERRLFYVGITRARNRLLLVYPQNRSSYGYSEPTEPSRFLEDIPMEMVEDSQPSRTRRRPSSSVPFRPDRWETPSKGSEAVLKPTTSRYQPGMRVAHPTWGEGMVLNSRLQDDDEIVDIFFEELGLKRVAASLAKLEVKE